VLPLQQNAKPFNTREDNMTEQTHTGKILLSIHQEDMDDCKQISPDEPSVAAQSRSYRNHRKLQGNLLIMLMILISHVVV